jgi:hypothetical protein
MLLANQAVTGKRFRLARLAGQRFVRQIRSYALPSLGKMVCQGSEQPIPMSLFDSLPIDRMRIYEPWTEAPMGTLLRMRAFRNSEAVVIGMCCVVPLLEKRFACFLPLEGHRFGTVLVPEQLAPDVAALDLSPFAELHVSDGVPRPVRDFVRGGVYETAPAGSGLSVLSLYCEFLDHSAGGSLVRLTEGAGGHRGEVATGSARLALGAVSVRPRSNSTI